MLFNLLNRLFAEHSTQINQAKRLFIDHYREWEQNQKSARHKNDIFLKNSRKRAFNITNVHLLS